MRLRITVAAVVAVAIQTAVVVRTDAPQDKAVLDPVVIKWDQGPDRIDVSKYPEDMKKRYKAFEAICGRCHTLARAVNCDFVLDDEWERYIKKMMRRGRGMISADQGLEVFEFAAYDSRRRKRELFEKKLAANR